MPGVPSLLMPGQFCARYRPRLIRLVCIRQGIVSHIFGVSIYLGSEKELMDFKPIVTLTLKSSLTLIF